MRKVSARWVPHRMTSDQAEHRLEVATAKLSLLNTESENFLSRIVATDETWVRSYEPALKRESAEWHTLISPWPAMFRTVKMEDGYDLCAQYSGCSHYSQDSCW